MNLTKFKENKRFYFILGSAIVILLLIFSTPVKALLLNLNMDKSEVNRSEYITFDLTLKINQAEAMDLNRIVFEISGPSYKSCIFDINGNVIDGCQGITIIKTMNKSDYGYGYSGYGYSSGGYGYSTSWYGYSNANDELNYRLIVDSSSLSAGEYNNMFRVFTGQNVYSIIGDRFIVKETTPPPGPGPNPNPNPNPTPEETAKRLTTRISGICESDWVCSSWSACNNGKQERVCKVRDDRCYGIEKPIEEKMCANNQDAINESVKAKKKQSEQLTSSIWLNNLIDFFGGFIGTGLYILIIFMSMLLGLCLGFIVTGENINSRGRRRKLG